MSDLIVFTYPDPNKAAEVLASVAKLKQDNVHKALIGIEDAAVVTKDKEGQVRVQQTLEAMVKGGSIASGGLWGVLIGFLFGGPLFGAILGMAASALLGYNLDVGIDNKFISSVTAQLGGGSSALFLLVKDTPPETLATAIQQFGGTLLHTSLNDDVKSAFGQVADHSAVKTALSGHGPG